MTTWTSIGNAAVAVGGIPSSSTVTALRDNPIALAEAASGAPVVFAGWHPYNKVTVGDGATGKFYDFAIHGLQTSFDTPDFEDGYEYRIVARNMSHSSGSSQTLNLEFLDDSLQSQPGSGVTGSLSSGSSQFWIDAQIFTPRIGAQQVPVLFLGNGVTTPFFSISAGGDDILRGRIEFSAGSIDGGQMYLLRRKEYISSP